MTTAASSNASSGDCAVIKSKFHLPAWHMYGIAALVLYEQSSEESIPFIVVQTSPNLFAVKLSEPWKELTNSLIRIRFQEQLEIPIMQRMEKSLRELLAHGGGRNLLTNIQDKRINVVRQQVKNALVESFKDPGMEIMFELETELVRARELRKQAPPRLEVSSDQDTLVKVKLMLDPVYGKECSTLSVGDKVMAEIIAESEQEQAIADALRSYDTYQRPQPIAGVVESAIILPPDAVELNVRLSPTVIGAVVMMGELKVQIHDPVRPAMAAVEKAARQDAAEAPATAEPARHAAPPINPIKLIVFAQLFVIFVLLSLLGYVSCSR